ncbi:unnamed protein product [Cuscuta campestris]|uniref:BHLH domain-containing protein n=2 Tax=Cuscuta campestris TaxID=132261 RepID=A0A484MQY6_9ASTE|nr:unnamed protein product [Cuscuta campestris]
MELPQPRAFGTDGRSATTHDFLSLYSPTEQDPRPGQGNFLRTHDFLQPLEEKVVGKEERKVKVVEKPSMLPHLPSMQQHSNLPGGIGTFSISHLQGVPKPEGSIFSMAHPSTTDVNDENSNSSSYTGSGFTLWDESVVSKGKTGKENTLVERRVLGGVNGVEQQRTVMEWPSVSSSNHRHSTATISSLSSPPQLTAQNNRSFLNMLASARSAQDEDDVEEDEGFAIKKEPSPLPQGDLSGKTLGKFNNQKPNTPRSKHSATEQRRRSKINDRFQMLRGIIPHSDQKRDKASFLLEVIEYIQFLQEKVQKYEGSYQGWEHEPTKFPWNKSQTGAQCFINHPHITNNGSDPALMFASRYAETKPVLPLINGQKVEPEARTCLVKDVTTNHHQSVPLPFNPNMSHHCGTSSIAASQTFPKLASDKDKPIFQHQSPSLPNHAILGDGPKDQNPSIESGTISISSIYSQGLLSSLTHALQSAGVDLSQACISVHVDLGKRPNGRLNSPSTIKGDDVSTSNEPILRSTVTNAGEETGQARKRIKPSRN